VRLLRRGGEGEVVPANAARLAITSRLGAQALRSTLFDLRADRKNYVVTGRGYGHGVGLSQWGAHAMARAGSDARQILAFYFPGTELRRLLPPSGDSVSHASPTQTRDPEPITQARRMVW
jgi:stage II sporulation protein D